MRYNICAMKRITVIGFLLCVSLMMAHALSWVGNTRLYNTGNGQLPMRGAYIESWQTVSVVTQTFPIEQGQRVFAVVTTNNWSTTTEYEFSFDFNTGNNSQWYVVLGPFAPGTNVQFYIRAQGPGGTFYDNNNWQNFGFYARYGPRYRSAPILQWFQTDYRTMMKRLPEVVMAGYGAIYLPSPVKSGGGGFSVGYNPFDRFDFGDRLQKGTVRTQYGTAQELQELIRLANRLGIEVYCDIVPNHNDNRASSAIDRYPDLIPEDFHIASSTNTGNTEIDFNNVPSFGFTTLNHDIVGLVDIAHENGNNTRTGAFNLPAYANFNQWDKPSFTRHPINPHYYPGGAPYAEDVRQYLKRWGWFMTSVIGFNGYRIDAVRHTPPAFFANAPDQPGSIVSEGNFLPLLYQINPNLYIFGEDYTSSGYELREYAKTGMNLLDFPLKFMASDLFNSNGFGNLGASLSNAPGIDPATGLPYEYGGLGSHVGVGFVQSHDDGPPRSNNLAHAWLLTRPARAKLYYDGNNIDPNNWSHFPKPGRYDALGNGNDKTLQMLDVRRRFARGSLVNRYVASNLYVYERQVNGQGVLLVGMNSRGDLTVQTVTVQTAFAPGTALIDYSGQQPPVVVQSNSRVTITIPSNSAPGNDNNAHGYVFYAPQTPRPVAGHPVFHLTDSGGNSIAFQTRSTPGGTYASGRSYEAATVTSDKITIRVRTDATGVSAALKLNNGQPFAGLPPLQNTPEGLTDGYVNMTRVENGTFTLENVDVSGLSDGLHVFTARVFNDSGNRPLMFGEFHAFIFIQRPERGRLVDGNLNDYGAPLVMQTRAPSSNQNRLDALYVRNDDQYLYVGIAGRVDTSEGLTNGVALFIDTDFGAGTGIQNFNLLDDDSGPATRLLSNGQVNAPAGFGAEFAVGVFRHSALHSSPEADYVGDAVYPPVVGAQAGFYRVSPDRLTWMLSEPARIAWLPRQNPNDPATGLEIALPLRTLVPVLKGRPLGLVAYLLNTGETGSTFAASDPRRGTRGGRPPVSSWVSNQFLPPQPNVTNNPGFTPVNMQTAATYTLQEAQAVGSPYRIFTDRMRYDGARQAYVLSGYVVNSSGSTLQAPLFMRMKLLPGMELLNRTGDSLFVSNGAYLLLTTEPLLPLGRVPFRLEIRASSPRGLPPVMELRMGEGAL